MRRFAANRESIPRLMNVVRAVSSEGAGRNRYYREVRGLLDTDRSMRRFFEGESTELPAFYAERVRREYGVTSPSEVIRFRDRGMLE